ncbi:MAG: glutaredoxin 3 [Deltaproteobacteria bacterium]|nr:glutaredoxin 3 [Deltaproteobacteria bacterium]
MPKVVIYTTSHCPYCVAAKKLFATKGISFKEINVDDDDSTWHWLQKKTGLATVPQIFINDVLYGGFEDVQKLDAAGKLDKLLT